MDPKIRQKTLRMLSNGMYILTSRSGDRYGAATVTWLSQASFKPPLIMAAVRPDSNVFECLRESFVAAVHVLGRHQQDIARKFLATTERSGDMLNGEPFTEGKTSAPILNNAPAYLECQVKQILNGEGDHRMIVMEVVEAEVRQETEPLLIADSPWHYGG